MSLHTDWTAIDRRDFLTYFHTAAHSIRTGSREYIVIGPNRTCSMTKKKGEASRLDDILRVIEQFKIAGGITNDEGRTLKRDLCQIWHHVQQKEKSWLQRLPFVSSIYDTKKHALLEKIAKLHVGIAVSENEQTKRYLNWYFEHLQPVAENKEEAYEQLKAEPKLDYAIWQEGEKAAVLVRPLTGIPTDQDIVSLNGPFPFSGSFRKSALLAWLKKHNLLAASETEAISTLSFLPPTSLRVVDTGNFYSIYVRTPTDIRTCQHKVSYSGFIRFLERLIHSSSMLRS